MSTVQPETDTRTPEWAETSTSDEGFVIHRSNPVKRDEVVAQLERLDVEDDASHVGRVDAAVWIRLADGDVMILDIPVKQAAALRDALTLLLERDLGW